MIEGLSGCDALHAVMSGSPFELAQDWLPWILRADCTRGVRSFTQLLTERADALQHYPINSSARDFGRVLALPFVCRVFGQSEPAHETWQQRPLPDQCDDDDAESDE